jgi:uncharacterized secreted protein with C-terminal beta-propeller domain
MLAHLRFRTKRLLASLCLLGLLFPSAPLAIAGYSREIIDHRSYPDSVEFTLTAKPSSVSLQGFVQKTGRWINLVSRSNPRQSLSRLPVPAKWRTAQLRVVATFSASSGKRVQIASQVDQQARAAIFTSTPDARLFSIEAKPNNATAWTRVSTVAAPASPQSIRVALPASVPSDAQVRVMAVSGPRKLFPPLKSPLSPTMRGGPSVFSPAPEFVSSDPLASVQISSTPSGDARQDASSSAVEESDIWKIRGKKIYFFNRLRGLQVIDASDPSVPRITGSLSMAGAGEEMYLLGADPASAAGAILVTNLPWDSDRPGATRIGKIGFAGDMPSLLSSLDLPGHYVESRMVGGMLHVVTAVWNSDGGPQTFLSSIDVSQNGILVQSSQEPLGLSAAVVGSTGKYLWLAGYSGDDWSRHTLFAIPFKVDGSLGVPLQATLAGRVLDKFKVGDTSDGLAVVLQDWSADWQQVTSVQTFGDNAGSLVPRGGVELVRGESLFATRYDRDRLYVVTFEQIDPLWIVDLSDSSKPEIKGHLEVPGWSTFIQPLGDTLVAVGRDGGKVQVSLFDVSDEADPKLAKRVDVGSGWSWSEAEWNEKAVKIMPDAGLILIPVVETDGATQSNRVSLLDFDPAARTLSLRGTIDHDFAPRRAALMENNVIASVSNRQLLLVDASNRDNPSLIADRTLAFGCDRVAVHDGTALMFENGGSVWSGSPRTAVLRTARTTDMESFVSEISLPCEQVAASEVVGDRLVVVETSGQGGFFGLFGSDLATQDTHNSSLSIWSLSDAARPVLIGRTALPFHVSPDAEIHPAGEGRIVIVSREQGWGYWIRPLRDVMPDLGDAILTASSSARIGQPRLGWGGQRLCLAVTDISGDAPAVLGTWELSGEEYTAVSDVYSTGELLAFSYDRREISAAGSARPVNYGWTSQQTRSWLQIIDLADPSVPMPWAPVQLPGQLVGVSWLQRAGGVLFARSGPRVAALGFDGENASMVAEVDAGAAVATQGSTLYVLAQSGVGEWEFSDISMQWKKGAGWQFDPSTGASSLHIFDGAVVAAAYDHAWVLREDGAVLTRVFPAGTDVGRAAQIGNTLFIPAGEYGTLPLVFLP